MPLEEDNRLDQTNPPDQNNVSGGISWRQAMGTVGLALAIPWMIGVPALIGWWLDKKYATSPLWIIVGLALGLLSTAVDIFKLLKRFGQFK
jgi:F0F1-type ATP synthase assembly protein I